MSKGLGWFLAFLALIVVLLAGAAWFLGPNVLAFIFHEHRNDAPVVMVGLFDFPDAQAKHRFVEDYAAPLRELIEAVGGRRLWSGRVEELLSGRAADHWPLIVLTEYPSRASFIDLVTSSDYRALLDARDAAISRAALYAGTPRSTFSRGHRGSYVIRFTRLDQGADYEAFDRKWDGQERELLDLHGGALVWLAELNPLVVGDDGSFDRLTVLAFPTKVAASAWTLDPARETLASLEGRFLSRDVMLLARTDEALGAGVE